ncbi:hypothetical protein BDZ91DRAFT_764222 [Kalaharituber pfeilii]|nr:hypothetical protein BDZ91DRAFT_764222 [Kalaharituber pfeilii]
MIQAGMQAMECDLALVIPYTETMDELEERTTALEKGLQKTTENMADGNKAWSARIQKRQEIGRARFPRCETEPRDVVRQFRRYKAANPTYRTWEEKVIVRDTQKVVDYMRKTQNVDARNRETGRIAIWENGKQVRFSAKEEWPDVPQGDEPNGGKRSRGFDAKSYKIGAIEKLYFILLKRAYTRIEASIWERHIFTLSIGIVWNFFEEESIALLEATFIYDIMKKVDELWNVQLMGIE